MKTYLVTGGAGFIGSNFILYLLKNHKDIHIVNLDALTYAGNLENLASAEQDQRYSFVHGDIRNRESLEKIFEKFSPDYVVNFAAESHVDRSIVSPEIFAETNVLGTVTLLNVAKSYWENERGGFSECKFLQISTDEVYGTLSLEEPDVFFSESTPLNPHSPYSASKAAADMFVLSYGDTYGLPINITRCSNNYGPYQFPEKLIPLMISNAVSHKQLPVYGDGLNVRDWLYVEDHCKAVDLVLSRGKIGEVYNIGGHNERSNLSVVKTIIDKCSTCLADKAISDSLISFVADRKGHDRRYGIAPDKIKKDLGWQPEVDFETGISNTIQWYLNNLEWVEHVSTKMRYMQ
ncbi:MAG: dTDP-glucose 4,6-dehydratase [Eggerthellaceae bacterium]|nr:dTDP-glucose 4,6-dehydratase [Eggerthellaceae bacterium]